MTPEQRSEEIKGRALQLGFDRVGITHLGPPPHGTDLREWLDAGFGGTMRYMHRQLGRRLEPAGIVAGATRAVVLTRNYYIEDPATAGRGGRVAKYARGRDYHAALQGPLGELAQFTKSLGDATTLARVFVDAGPVPERELAQRAGLGWIGKNTMLIDPTMGSFVFLASILTDLDLAIDTRFEADRCGSCRRCLDACPTNAFVAERVLDARRCISYLTIEFKGEVDAEIGRLTGDWVFGCDVCQDVCPWNEKFAKESRDPVLKRDQTLAYLDLDWLCELQEEEFQSALGWTAMERSGASGMRRNADLARINFPKESPCRTSLRESRTLYSGPG